MNQAGNGPGLLTEVSLANRKQSDREFRSCHFAEPWALLSSTAKTFLGTFRVNNPRFDAVLSRSTTLHEIQREILQLVGYNVHRCCVLSDVL